MHASCASCPLRKVMEAHPSGAKHVVELPPFRPILPLAPCKGACIKVPVLPAPAKLKPVSNARCPSPGYQQVTGHEEAETNSVGTNCIRIVVERKYMEDAHVLVTASISALFKT